MARARILLVDDDLDFTEIVKAMLEKDFEIATAASGEKALARVAESRPDLIVLDVMMKHLSEGYDVARKLKSDPETQKIPIIMLTGVDEVYDIRSQTDESWRGCDRYLSKPPDPRELRSTINELLASSQNRA